MVKKVKIDKIEDLPKYTDVEIIEDMLKNRNSKTDNLYKKGWIVFVNKEKAKKYGIEQRREIYQNSFIVLWNKVLKHQMIVKDQHVICYDTKGEIRVIADLMEWLMNTVDNKIKEFERTLTDVFPKDLTNELSNDLSEDIRETIDKEKRLNIVRECVEEMNEKCRTILYRYYWENIQREEIREEVGYKNGETVSNKKEKCLAIIKKNLKNLFKINNIDIYTI